MLLGALERLVLFVRPLLLMVSVASLGARPHRLLLAAQPPHPSTHLVPQAAVEVPRRPWFSWSSVQTRWSPSHTQEHFELGVLHLAAFVAHLSPDNIRSECRSRGCHSPLTSPTILRIPTWVEVSTCKVLDLARGRSLQTAISHFGSSSGTVDSTSSSGHPRLVENVPTGKPRVGSPITQLGDPFVLPHHTSFPNTA